MLELDHQGCPSQVRDEFDPRGTSRQRNTHSIESREVRYPWHPWHDRVVAIHQSFTRNGRALFRCSIEENLEARLLEIPQWMFDPATCCRMRLAAVPTVSCKALLDLKSLLQCTLLPESDGVLGVCREYGITRLIVTVRVALGSGKIGSWKPALPHFLPSYACKPVIRSPRMAFPLAWSGHLPGSP
jgi:hypothetical protein